MRTIAILPMKRFAEAKSRLATGIGGGARQALAQAMFADVLASLRRVEGLEAVAVVRLLVVLVWFASECYFQVRTEQCSCRVVKSMEHVGMGHMK